eukprot:2078695-Pyramimonas_sp.AAC.1
MYGRFTSFKGKEEFRHGIQFTTASWRPQPADLPLNNVTSCVVFNTQTESGEWEALSLVRGNAYEVSLSRAIARRAGTRGSRSSVN